MVQWVDMINKPLVKPDEFSCGYAAAVENMETIVNQYLETVTDDLGRRALKNITESMRNSVAVAIGIQQKPELYLYEPYRET